MPFSHRKAPGPLLHGAPPVGQATLVAVSVLGVEWCVFVGKSGEKRSSSQQCLYSI